ncbi:hypothetical protein [Bacillus atrophaeus]|uniref:hypothetical protein n=1 Tax=Bacillus atrophaeus TaxID=1452 RepID=UPI00227F7613|nr:hypothetical protein [Bacillus atrophaeus]MCY8975648.1 hypothetical protein [Bacillus atrophaeus]
MNNYHGYSPNGNYIPHHQYPTYQQPISHQHYRQPEETKNINLTFEERDFYQDLGHGMELIGWNRPKQTVGTNPRFLTATLQGRRDATAINAGWSIGHYRPAYAIESYNNIVRNRSDQWIITIYNASNIEREVVFYLITKRKIGREFSED